MPRPAYLHDPAGYKRGWCAWRIYRISRHILRSQQFPERAAMDRMRPWKSFAEACYPHKYDRIFSYIRHRAHSASLDIVSILYRCNHAARHHTLRGSGHESVWPKGSFVPSFCRRPPSRLSPAACNIRGIHSARRGQKADYVTVPRLPAEWGAQPGAADMNWPEWTQEPHSAHLPGLCRCVLQRKALSQTPYYAWRAFRVCRTDAL